MNKLFLYLIVLYAFNISAADKKHSKYIDKSTIPIAIDPIIQSYVDQVSGDSIYSYLQKLESLGLKSPGTTALSNTRDWLYQKYSDYGYSDIVYHDFTYSSYTLQNIVVTKTGTKYPDIYVIIDGHYDTIGGPGVNDNGSGVALILEIARIIANVDCDYSIKFINFSAEEQGLIGSTAYVNQIVVPQNMQIKLVFNIDEVGGIAGQVNNTITCERDEGNPGGNNAASWAYTDTLAALTETYSTLNTAIAHAYGSDYMPFEDAGYVITGYYETNESPYPHGPNDILANMDPPYVTELTKAAVASALYFSGIEKKYLKMFHDPYSVVQNNIDPYPLEIGMLSSSTILNPELLYRVDGAAFSAVQLNYNWQNGDTLFYQGEIPAQDFNATVDYYFNSTNADSVDCRLPPEENSYFTFQIKPDTVAPTVIHTPLTDQSYLNNPLIFTVEASDESGILNSYINVKINDGLETEILMSAWIGDEYRAELADTLNPGDILSYRFHIIDNSTNQNETWYPNNNYFTFEILNSELFDFENGMNAFSANGDWQWGQLTDLSIPQSQGEKMWATNLSGNYSTNLNSEMISPLINLSGKQDARLVVQHFYQIEPNNDGANIKISADGMNFNVIIPENGYPYPDLYLFNEPGYSGNSYYWLTDVFDLSTYTSDSIRIKLDFRSDIFTTRKGWYIDYIRLDFKGIVSNHPPYITYFYPANLDTVRVNTSHLFSVKAQDADDDSLTIRYYHGDAMTEDSVAVFTFNQTGPDTVYAVVHDEHGQNDSHWWTFYVKDTTTDFESTDLIASDLYLYPVYPNPFNPVTNIKFDNPEKQHIEISVYNTGGKLISRLLSGEKNKGTHIVTFDAHKFASGLYFIELTSARYRKVERALLLK